jgi:hypothetical protein
MSQAIQKQPKLSNPYKVQKQWRYLVGKRTVNEKWTYLSNLWGGVATFLDDPVIPRNGGYAWSTYAEAIWLCKRVMLEAEDMGAVPVMVLFRKESGSDWSFVCVEPCPASVASRPRFA